ncbi:MAG: uroporphyrinogen decarboxylase family protein [Candidatus Choladocola sp.]|nr:uroporphyrinogen decarboxylase family protein [Candidatus Choladocola sp.]
MSKRDFIFSVLDNKPTDRVPVGFWFHFVPDGLKEYTPENIRKNLEGHKKFYEAFQPDLLKIMSDGFFVYPNDTISGIKTPEDLNSVKASHPEKWIQDQIDLVKELVGLYGNEVVTLYNIFAPATYLWWGLEAGNSPVTVEQAARENPEGLKHALEEIASDIRDLAVRAITEGGADGIYLSVRNIQGTEKEKYLKYVAPGELEILNAANGHSEYNVLHICGYAGYKNDLTVYTDYPAKAFNWAVTTENVSLAEGKKLFGGRAVIGGFDHTTNGVLYKGTREEIEKETGEILKNAGNTGVMIGADCTVPADIDISHLQWVREKAGA